MASRDYNTVNPLGILDLRSLACVRIIWKSLISLTRSSSCAGSSGVSFPLLVSRPEYVYKELLGASE